MKKYRCKTSEAKWCHNLSHLFLAKNNTIEGQLEVSAEPFVTSKGPGIRGDKRGRGGPVSPSLREITINS